MPDLFGFAFDAIQFLDLVTQCRSMKNRFLFILIFQITAIHLLFSQLLVSVEYGHHITKDQAVDNSGRFRSFIDKSVGFGFLASWKVKEKWSIQSGYIQREYYRRDYYYNPDSLRGFGTALGSNESMIPLRIIHKIPVSRKVSFSPWVGVQIPLDKSEQNGRSSGKTTIGNSQGQVVSVVSRETSSYRKNHEVLEIGAELAIVLNRKYQVAVFSNLGSAFRLVDKRVVSVDDNGQEFKGVYKYYGDFTYYGIRVVRTIF